MKQAATVLIFLGVVSIAGAQSPQFSQFYANPLLTNPAMGGDAGVSRLIASYRNQWATLGRAFQTGAASFDTYLDAKQIGWGAVALHDQRATTLQSNFVAVQMSKLTYITGSRQLRLIGGAQVGWVSNRWFSEGLVFVSDLLGSPDPLANSGLNENRLSVSLGTILEFVPNDHDRTSWWLGGSWHNIAINPDKWMGQRFGIQGGLKIPFDSPGIFGNNLGHDFDRETSLSLAAQVRKQGPLYQADIGGNFIYSPVLLGIWYRGEGLGGNRSDAIIPTAGFLSGNVLLQLSYDFPVSSLGPNTGALELTLWYGFDNFFQYRGNGRNGGRFLRY